MLKIKVGKNGITVCAVNLAHTAPHKGLSLGASVLAGISLL